MMPTRRSWLAAAALALSGCTPLPSANFYTLAAVPGAVRRSRAFSVELRRVGVAGYLDRPEIVRTTQDFRLHLNELDHWGEPLGGMLDRVLVENLAQRLPDVAVFAASGAISTKADLLLEIDIQRLDAGAAGPMVLLAQTALRPDGGTARAKTTRVEQAITGPTTEAQVAAMSHALAKLADEIAAMIAAM